MRDMTPEDVRDMKMRQRAGKAYDQAMTNTPAAPKPAAPAPKKAMTVGEQEMVDEAKDAKSRKKISDMGYKKGGSVSASKRADGCAQRGKTRGKMM